MTPSAAGLRVLYLYRDSPLRRDALRTPPGSAHRYVLFGLDQHADHGVRARHNLEAPAPIWARGIGRAAGRLVHVAGGPGGDFPGVLAVHDAAKGADAVFATVDTVGLPLACLQRAGLMRRPTVYAAIGLPERLAALRDGPARRATIGALGDMAVIAAYSLAEVDAIRALVGEGPRFEFVPFGVDLAHFSPQEVECDVDVVSLGADPHRDFQLLLEVAARRPELRFRLVATAAEADVLRPVPANVELEEDVPFAHVRDRLLRGRVVALPVRPNSYSGATTVLLQSLALGKPVVVSEIPAIAAGYGLEDGVTCRFVPPADAVALERAVVETLDDDAGAAAIGRGGRAAAERLPWSRYADAMLELLVSAGARLSTTSR